MWTLLRATVLVAALAVCAPRAEAAFQNGNLICENTTTTGTGTLNLSEVGCDAGDFVTFASQITSGNTVTYTIVATDGTLETGTGVYTAGSPDTLSRTPLWSSAGAATALTLSAGTHRVYLQWNTASFNGGLNAFDILTLSVDNLNDVTAINTATENTIEAAIDTLANLTAIQGVSFTLTAAGATILDNADPAAHSIVGWNDTGNAYVDKTLGTGITTDADSVDLDADLATIAGLTATTDNFMIAVSSAWASRTPGQAAVTLCGADPNADKLAFWDDSAGTCVWLTVPTSFIISGTSATIRESFIVAASDETTNLTTGTGKVKWRMPYAFTVTAVRCSLSTAQTAGSIITFDINESGTTIISTKVTIDNSELTSTTAAAAPVISDSALADDAEMSIDIDQVGTALAKGLKCTLIGNQ